MGRVCFTMLLALALTVPSYADVTIKQTTGSKGMGVGGNATGTTYITGHKMRAELPPAEFGTYGRAVGTILADIIMEVLDPLYAEHPDLKPPEMR